MKGREGEELYWREISSSKWEKNMLESKKVGWLRKECHVSLIDEWVIELHMTRLEPEERYRQKCDL